jgi:hypothetical protein
VFEHATKVQKRVDPMVLWHDMPQPPGFMHWQPRQLARQTFIVLETYEDTRCRIVGPESKLVLEAG